MEPFSPDSHVKWRRLLVVVAVALAAGATASIAVGASAPTITFGTPSVSGFNATLTYSVSRGAQQIAGITCSLTRTGGTTSGVGCGRQATTSTKETSYAVALSGLNAGSYTYSVTVKLTDGGRGSSSRSFTVTPVAASCTVTHYSVTYDGGAHTAAGTCSGVGGVDLTSDLHLAGTTHTNAGSYQGDTWSFSDPTGNYTNPGGTVADTISQAPQTIAFTSSAPSAAQSGDTYTPAATATSGLPVSFKIDEASSSVCSLSGGVVTANGAGSCKVDANQSGSANYAAAPQVQQSFTVTAPPTLVKALPDIQINSGEDLQSPVVPPADVSQCPSQDPDNGGCAINQLDGSVDNTFDASNSVDPNVNPSQDQVQYHWQIFYPPVFGRRVGYSAAGITGYQSPVLHIAPESLPELDGDPRVGSDIYWRVELTITVTTPNGTIGTVVFFRFSYSSDFSLDISTGCQLSGMFMGYPCSLIAPQLLPNTTEPL